MTETAPGRRTLADALLALAAGCCAIVVACQKPGATVCPSGRYCPDGSQCAANQDVCIFDACGNGKLDPGEVCDDGNILDGDGCSSTCRSNETCGNGVWDPHARIPEVCDWLLDPANCSSRCDSNLTCGNGKVDAERGEECDPVVSSPPVNTQTCTSHCTWTRRGDGWVNPVAGYGPEECDRDGVGNTVAGPGNDCEWVGTVGTTAVACNADCTPSRHGDGRVNLSDGEECDVDGHPLSSTAVHSSCESESCNADCTWSVCGDGKPNHTAGEMCDDAHADDQGDCTRYCLWNVCGDGIQQIHGARLEECDRGAENISHTATPSCDYGQTCTFCRSGNVPQDPCTIATVVGPRCGDGVVQDPPEQCDSATSFITCGTCDAGCHWIPRRRAEGSIDVLSVGSIVAGDTITIDDRISPPVILEFADDVGQCTATTTTCVRVARSASNDAAANLIRSVISGTALNMTTSASGSTVSLVHNRRGLFYDRPITASGTSVAVSPAQAAVVVSGMSGGVGCILDQPCTSDQDCVSQSCQDSGGGVLRCYAP